MSDDTNRPPIPTELRRRVLVEAGHRCAIPTCRHIEVDIHHIVPYAKCQTHEYENLIALCPNCHRRADRDDIDRKALRIYKANLRFAHDKYSQLELDLMFELYRMEPNAPLQWPPFMRMLLKRALDSRYLSFELRQNGRVIVAGMRTDPGKLRLTPEGRKFLNDLGGSEF